MKKRYIVILVLVVIGIISSSIYFISFASSYSQSSKAYQVLRSRLLGTPKRFYGVYSLVVKDLKKPDLEVSRNCDLVFPAASLIKLPLLVVGVKAVNEQKLSLDTIVVIKQADIAGGSGILKAARLPLRLTFRKLLELMIAHSDNTATNKVIEILGYDYINSSFKELGFKNTILKRKMMDFSLRRKGIDNFTTASEISDILEQIYNCKLMGKDSCEFMISLLKKQKMRDRIPRYLPSGVSVAHKTGLERGVVHDAGIVFSPKGDYIVCVLTKKVKNYHKAKLFIARVALITYKLYQRLI